MSVPISLALTGKGFILTIGEFEAMDNRFLGPFKEWSVQVPLKAGLLSAAAEISKRL